MKLYIAHNYAARQWIVDEVVPRLEANGISVAARWLSGKHDRAVTDADSRQFAEEDFYDVRAADGLLYFCDQFGSRPGLGKHIELGIAAAGSKPIAVVGENCDASVFYFLPGIQRFETLER